MAEADGVLTEAIWKRMVLAGRLGVSPDTKYLRFTKDDKPHIGVIDWDREQVYCFEDKPLAPEVKIELEPRLTDVEWRRLYYGGWRR
jgi:hypothetical protein